MKYMKLICIISIIGLLFICTSNYYIVSATSSSSIVDPDNYKPTGLSETTKLTEKANVVIGALRIFGTIVAVVAIMIIGIKYMAGSVSERAEYKETMIPYLVGAVLIFTITNLLGIIYDLVSSVNF